MTFVVDASVVVRWFVDQSGSESAARWLRAFAKDPDLLVGPDLLRFEVHGALCRLQPKRQNGWATQAFQRFERLGMKSLPTTLTLFGRAAALSREVPVGGYDAIYLALAEELGVQWLTADAKALRRLRGDGRIKSL